MVFRKCNRYTQILSVIPEQVLKRGFAYVTALYNRRQYTVLIVKRLAERATVIQVNRKRVVAEQCERFVMMAVHVAHEEVEYGQVHNVQHSASAIVRR